MKYIINPPEEMIEDAVVTLPLSKSISMRALVLDAMTDGAPADNSGYIAHCDDTAVMEAALKAVMEAGGEHVSVDVGASGAALRFLTAYFAALPGCDVTLTGTERLCTRPMQPLIRALRECGAQVDCIVNDGFAPVRVKGCRLIGGEITVDATISSQFISALLMAAPKMAQGLTVHLEGEPVSLPYILMTLGMMAQRGVDAEREPLKIVVPAGEYKPFVQPAEGDWSGAAFWYEISALSAGWITMSNLKAETLQGDKAVAKFFECLGVTTQPSEEHEGMLELCPSPEVFGRLDLDLADNPDLAPALVVTCCLIGVPFKFVGLQNLGVKESDRLEALCAEMDKIGRRVEKVREFGLEWDGKGHPIIEMPVLDAHGDHRLAMALAPAAIYIPGIVVDGVEAVAKSYPEYWEQLKSIGFTLEEAE